MVTAAAAAGNRSLPRGGSAERKAAIRRRQVDRINAAATGTTAPISPSARGTSSSTPPTSVTAGKPEADSAPKSCAFFWSQFHDFERRLNTESSFNQPSTVDGKTTTTVKLTMTMTTTYSRVPMLESFRPRRRPVSNIDGLR
jgi:hypothetical protein